MTSFSAGRLLTMGLGVLLAWACTVADKGEYEFNDTPGEAGEGGTGGGSGGASGGKGGKGGGAGTSTGGKGGRGGSSGSGGSAAQAGVGAEGGEAGTSGDAGASATGGAGGTAGTGGGDPCDPNPCQHGDCSVDGSDYDCDCDTGWEGSRCQTNIDDCDPNPCENGGTCDDGLDEYTCTCTPGYSGDTCEIAPVDCDPDPCVNGTCMELAGGISCTCDAGWTGDNCTTNINECDPDPCEHGGTCRDQVNGYACDCSNTGYTGTTCSMDDDECMSNPPCQHGGMCTNSTGGYSCTCTGTGYTGMNCQTDVNECTSSPPCQHGGACTNSAGSYSCNCAGTGYSGMNCDTNVNDCNPNPCNMGTCADGVNDYTCTCPSGSSGENCERYCGNGTKDGATVQSITLTYAALHCYTPALPEFPLFLNGVAIHGLSLGGCDCAAGTPRTAVITDPGVLAAVRPTGNVFEVRKSGSGSLYTGYVQALFGLAGATDVQLTGLDGSASMICSGSTTWVPVIEGSMVGPAVNVPGTEACDGASGCTACGCPSGQIVCSSRCTDIVTTETTCGSCNTACGSGQECLSGRCKTIMTVDHFNKGWWDSTGSHDAGNPNTYTGNSYGSAYNSFFAFNIPSFTGTVESVRLEIQHEAYFGADASETFGIYDVTTATATLIATGSAQVAIYNDLQTGTQYGSFVVSSGTLGTVVSADMGLAATNISAARGSTFAFGLHGLTMSGAATEEGARWDGYPPVVRLILTVAP